MKAVILAGGRGSRLLPLTARRPKPLCTLLGKPVIGHILTLLKQNGVEEAAVTLGYRGDMLRTALEGYRELPLSFFEEREPLGTAGGVKLAAREFSGDFVVISGDAMCDFDLRAALRFHQRSGSAATILTHRVDDPREYGLVRAGEQGRVEGFEEKPSFLGCVSDQANTGIYLLSPAVLERIPDGRPSDFAKDIFPALLGEGWPVYAYEPEGYWCDIGNVKSYLACQSDMLAGRVRFCLEAAAENGNIRAGRLPGGSYCLKAPCYVGRDVSIGEGCVIGPGAVLEDGARLGSRCRAEGCVIGRNARLGDSVRLSGGVVCDYAGVDSGACIGEECIVGDSASVEADAVLNPGARIWPDCRLNRDALLEEDLRESGAAEHPLTDDGLGGGLTPELCVRAGEGLASLGKLPSVGVARSDGAGMKAFALACMSGASAGGGNVWDFGECTENLFLFCLWQSRADYGVYVDGGEEGRLRFYAFGGLPLPREEERKLEAALNRREFRRLPPKEMGRISSLSAMAELYPFELFKLCDVPLDGLTVQVRCASRPLERLLEGTLEQLGCRIGDGGMTVRLSPDGKSAELTGGGHRLSRERFLAAVCLTEFAAGRCAALPRSAPRSIDGLAEKYGASLLRYSECPNGDGDERARKAAAAQPFLRDALMGTVKLFAFLVKKELSFPELCREIPSFSVNSRSIPLAVSPGVLLRRLSAQGDLLSEGVLLRRGERSALVRPLKSGKGVLLFAESRDSETAEETGDLFERMVREAGGST